MSGDAAAIAPCAFNRRLFGMYEDVHHAECRGAGLAGRLFDLGAHLPRLTWRGACSVYRALPEALTAASTSGASKTDTALPIQVPHYRHKELSRSVHHVALQGHKEHLEEPRRIWANSLGSEVCCDVCNTPMSRWRRLPLKCL